MMYFVIAIFALFILILMAFQLQALFLKHPAHPPFEKWTLDSFPREVQQYFSHIIPILNDEGFNAVCFCRQTTPSIKYFTLFKHQNKQAIAIVISGPPCDADILWQRFVEFISETSTQLVITNNNLHHPLLAFQSKAIKRYNFPTIHDLHKLYLMHRASLRHHTQDVELRLYEDGQEFEQFKRIYMTGLRAEVERGFMYVATTSNTYRPTLKGAFFTGLLTSLNLILLWPFGGIRKRLISRRLNRIIKSIEQARKQVEQDDISIQRFSSGQRRIHHEQREFERKAAFQEPKPTNLPRLVEEQKASGLLIDITDQFRGGSVKNAVCLRRMVACVIFLSITTLLTLAAMMSVFSTGNQFFETKKLEYFGASTQATVLDRRVETIEKDNDGTIDVVHRYYITYRFQAVSGARQWTSAREEQVTEQDYRRFAIGNELTVVYDRKLPSLSRIKGNYVIFSFSDRRALSLSSYQGLLTLLLLSIGAFIGGVFVIRLFIWLVTDVIALWFLHTRGQVTTASIVELRKNKGSEFTEYMMSYRFQVRDTSGKTTSITGGQEISERVYDTYRTQKTVNVRYVPARPEWFKLEL